MSNSRSQGTALITGASAGIGAIPAYMMERNGSASRRRGVPSRSGSAMPCQRPDTGVAHPRGSGPDARSAAGQA